MENQETDTKKQEDYMSPTQRKLEKYNKLYKQNSALSKDSQELNINTNLETK